MVIKVEDADPALAFRWKLPKVFPEMHPKVTLDCWKLNDSGLPVPARGKADASRINRFYDMLHAAIMVDCSKYYAIHWLNHLRNISLNTEIDCGWRVEATILLHAIEEVGQLTQDDRRLLYKLWSNPSYNWTYINPTDYQEIIVTASRL